MAQLNNDSDRITAARNLLANLTAMKDFVKATEPPGARAYLYGLIDALAVVTSTQTAEDPATITGDGVDDDG
ncbi:MAG: hypothetical protein LLG14_16590 [Nocardiaceae bacterium]|nr:hypothetical protein [Nocardiaceae bacterium]